MYILKTCIIDQVRLAYVGSWLVRFPNPLALPRANESENLTRSWPPDTKPNFGIIVRHIFHQICERTVIISKLVEFIVSGSSVQKYVLWQ